MKIIKNKKVMVAMSGGVDSSVAAFLLQQQGYEVVGVYMRLFDTINNAENAARRVCQKLNIKFYPVNLSGKFQQEVIDYFISSYQAGITPNPCVQCNKLIKFGAMLQVMQDLECDYLATGHYIRAEKKFDLSQFKFVKKLFRGQDKSKDQSYFLYNLSRAQLQKIIFPLGRFEKKTIRKIAAENNLPTLSGESQDICFMNIDGKIAEHNDFLKQYIKTQKGPIKMLDGKIVGEHQGLPFYTIGQRRGVEIGGTGPYYVVKMDEATNTLFVSNDHDDPALYSRELKIKNINWIKGKSPCCWRTYQVMIRYRHQAVPARVFPEKNGEAVIKFSEPQRAVMPGQSAVIYRGSELIGGGVINN